MKKLYLEFYALVNVMDDDGETLRPIIEKFWIGPKQGRVAIRPVKELGTWMIRDSYHQAIDSQSSQSWYEEVWRVEEMVVTMAAARMASNQPDWDMYLWELGFRP